MSKETKRTVDGVKCVRRDSLHWTWCYQGIYWQWRFQTGSNIVVVDGPPWMTGEPYVGTADNLEMAVAFSKGFAVGFAANAVVN